MSINQMGPSYLTPLLFTEHELYSGKHGGVLTFFFFGKIKAQTPQQAEREPIKGSDKKSRIASPPKKR